MPAGSPHPHDSVRPSSRARRRWRRWTAPPAGPERRSAPWRTVRWRAPSSPGCERAATRRPVLSTAVPDREARRNGRGRRGQRCATKNCQRTPLSRPQPSRRNTRDRERRDPCRRRTRSDRRRHGSGGRRTAGSRRAWPRSNRRASRLGSPFCSRAHSRRSTAGSRPSRSRSGVGSLPSRTTGNRSCSRSRRRH